MRQRVIKTGQLLAVLAMAAGAVSPAGAASGYHMNGVGSISLGGGGLPACAHVVQQGDCANVDISFSWGELLVQGAGLLQDAQVAGQYDCRSEGTIGNRAFQSRILGNTTNFELTFNFACTRVTGVGPANVNGWFSNYNGGSAQAAFRNVAGHPYAAAAQPGTFNFVGYFRTTNTHPYDITSGAPMLCGGGFAPTQVANGTRITTAAFVGHCNAAP